MSTGTGGDRRPGELAGDAYEAVRALNRATLPGGCELDGPEEACRVLADLAALLGVTPQALSQVAGWLGREQRAGRLRAVNGEHAHDPPAAVAALADHVSAAVVRARAAATQVDQAHQIAATLARTRPDL